SVDSFPLLWIYRVNSVGTGLSPAFEGRGASGDFFWWEWRGSCGATPVARWPIPAPPVGGPSAGQAHSPVSLCPALFCCASHAERSMIFRPPDAAARPQAPVRPENFRHQPKEEAMNPFAVPATLLGGLCVFLSPPAYAAEGHAFVTPSELKWTDVPALPPGAQIAVIEGPLNEAVPFTFRIKLPADFKIPAH